PPKRTWAFLWSRCSYTPVGLLLGLAFWTGPSAFAVGEPVPPLPFEPVDWGESVTSRDAAVRSARPDRPDDPFLPKQYWLENVGQADDKGRTGFPGCDLRAFEAWKQYKPKQEIVLAIIDSGLDLTHEDIDPSCLWTNPGESGTDAEGRDKASNGVDDDGNGYIDDVHGWNFMRNSPDVQEDQYHGTHVGGLLVARSDNGTGIAGAYPGLKVMLVKVFGLGNYLSSEKFAEAIRYAANNGAKVLSNSYGTPSYTQAMHDAVRHCLSKGALFVCASGNSRKNMDLEDDRDYPSCFGVENQLVVGATNNRDFSTFSNYGSMVEIAAPGEAIFSLMPKSTYRSFSGTSQACPLVAGAACWVWAMNPQFSWRDVKARLLDSADQIAGLGLWVRGGLRLNLANALAGKPGKRLSVEDFSRWHEETRLIETTHPYKNNVSLTWDIGIPGAKKMRLHVARLGIEHYSDTLMIEDGAGRELQFFNDYRTDFWTDVIPTGTARLVFTSNDTSTDYGFTIDRVQWSD
ncbi:MAG TPA: S8 family peptidase, partial [Candidatus Ozemobacteraceae bacterium]|nr:S8 family peptidase [Candidatus Ozemobacteraceae bacterium]